MKAYKTELDPNNKQRSFFSRCAGTSRYVYNWGLAEWKRQYDAGEKPSQYGLCKQFNSIKDEMCPWIRELPYAVVESSFVNLGYAFKNFFRRIKAGDVKSGYPRFKKRGIKTSFQLRGTKIENDRVRLTGIGWVRLKESNYIPSAAEYGIYATISERAGRWFISVLVKNGADEKYIKNGNGYLGIDLGVKALATFSDGTVFENPKTIYKYEKQLARLNRELHRRKPGSANRKKTKERLSRLYYKTTNIRKHALHQVSYYATAKSKPGVIVLENLNVKGMTANHHLSRAVLDASFGELRRQIEYKAARRGIEVVLADRWFASSKTCSRCGCINQNLKLSDRTYVCNDCGLTIDRDLNAAINLAALAEGRNAPGLPVELAGLPATEKQEVGSCMDKSDTKHHI